VLPIPTESGACALPILGHTYGHTYGWMDGCTYICTYIRNVHFTCGSGRLNKETHNRLNKETHNVEMGTLVCCKQQLKIVATDL
jgi:hypothetical protein